MAKDKIEYFKTSAVGYYLTEYVSQEHVFLNKRISN